MDWLTRYSQLVCLQILVFFFKSSANLCPYEQSSALLQFKQLFSFENHVQYSSCEGIQPSYPKMMSWNEDSDCCSWDGVTCDMATGHVIGLDLSCSWLYGDLPSNSSLFFLPHLQKINLAFNNFDYSEISSSFSRFPSLTHLNLSSSNFVGQVPSEISQLSKLVSLDLSHNFPMRLQVLVWKELAQNLTKLKELVLDWVEMSSIEPSSLTNLSSSLTSLNLSGCGLQGKFPENLFHLPNLQRLVLSENNVSGSFPTFNWSIPLRILDLSFCNFKWSIPVSLGNLTQLTHLMLHANNFSGHIPSSLSNLVQLNHLDFSSNYISGEIPDIFFNLTQLSHLDISGNLLTGPIPSSVSRLRNLTHIDLASSSLRGTIPSGLFSPSLNYVSLEYNHLTGSIPSSIFQAVNLKHLFLSSNNFSGKVEFYMFAKLKNLEILYLSNNSLSVNPTLKDNTSFPSLSVLGLSACNISEFPDVLRTRHQLQHLYLSNNQIHGRIPEWIWDNVAEYSLFFLDLSQNFLTNIERIPWGSLRYLDLSSNILQGQLFPVPTSILRFFFISNNNLTGEIDHSICNVVGAQHLDLSNNTLSGPIPECVGNLIFMRIFLVSDNNLVGEIPYSICKLSELEVLNLSNNNLSGRIPDCIGNLPSLRAFLVSNNNLYGEIPSSFCISSSLEFLDLSNNSLNGTIPKTLGNSSTLSALLLQMNNFHGNIFLTFTNGSSLTTLNLNGNQLEGILPSSLVNCTKLEVLDVGNNRIADTFPHWLADHSALQVLILRSNKFHGPIANFNTRFGFPRLRILDISHNEFSGFMPAIYLQHFEAMIHGKNDNVQVEYMKRTYDGKYYSVLLTIKGIDMWMERILTIFMTIDLSSNRFQGRIPEVIGKLNLLKGLNLSHNNLTGGIPSSLGNLAALESLDLSSNKLIGKIPTQLTNLTCLSVLKLANNQLVGPIPQGQQFNTFGSDSYNGNLGLCGFPLPEICSNDEASDSGPTIFHEEDDDNSRWFDWKVAMMGYGSGLVIGLSTGYMVFATGRPRWFVKMVERKQSKRIRRLNRGRRNY